MLRLACASAAWAPPSLQERCWGSFPVGADRACCPPGPACPARLAEADFPLELCCLGELPPPSCGGAALEGLGLGGGEPLARQPVQLFGALVEDVAGLYLGEPLSENGRRRLEAAFESSRAVEEHCPLAHALSQALQAELALAASVALRKGGQKAAFLATAAEDYARAALRSQTSIAPGPGSDAAAALLKVAHRRVAWWSSAAKAWAAKGQVGSLADESPFVRRVLRAFGSQPGAGTVVRVPHPPSRLPWAAVTATQLEGGMRGARPTLEVAFLEAMEALSLARSTPWQDGQFWPTGQTLVRLHRYGALEASLARGRTDAFSGAFQLRVAVPDEATFLYVADAVSSRLVSRGWRGCHLLTSVSEGLLDARDKPQASHRLTCTHELGGTAVQGELLPEVHARGAAAPPLVTCSAYGRPLACPAPGWEPGEGVCAAVPELWKSCADREDGMDAAVARWDEDLAQLLGIWSSLDRESSASLAGTWAQDAACQRLRAEVQGGSSPCSPAQGEDTEVAWLRREGLRWAPNPLCWTEDRRAAGATPEACCRDGGSGAGPHCWDEVRATPSNVVLCVVPCRAAPSRITHISEPQCTNTGVAGVHASLVDDAYW